MQGFITGEVAADPFCFGTGPYAAKNFRLFTNSQVVDTTHRNTVTVGSVEVEVAKANGNQRQNPCSSLYGRGALYPL